MYRADCSGRAWQCEGFSPICHVNHAGIDDFLVACAEMAMLDNGIKIQPGSGVAAAQAVYRANPLLKA